MLIKTSLLEVNVDIKYASLLGLMVNELITNAIKYAVPYAEKGEIQINMGRVGDQIILCVSDNGPGLPDGFDPYAANSLGLKLIRMIAEQIGGAITIDSFKGKGTSVTITFPHRPDA